MAEDFDKFCINFQQIDQITDTTVKEEIYSAFNQLFSNSFCLGFAIDQFSSVSDTAKLILIKNTEYWINNNWEQIVQEELVETLREFLFVTLPPIQLAQSQHVCDAISFTQARYCMRTISDIWPNFFSETFFDEEHLQLAISFILNLCKMLSTPQYYERETVIGFRDFLSSSDQSSMFLDTIFRGISQGNQNAFIAVGYYSICFTNTWISEDELFQAFGTGMENFPVNTLESINLLLQSPFSSEDKMQIISSLNLLEVITAGSENEEIIAKYAEIVYTLTQIFPTDSEVYPVLLEQAVGFLPGPDRASIYGCLALTSALNHKISEISGDIVTNCLEKMHEINTRAPFLIPSDLAQNILELMKRATTINIEDGWAGFEQIVEKYGEEVPDSLPTDVTLLQYVYIFRGIMPNFKDQFESDITLDVMSQFDSLIGAQSELAPEQKFVYYAFYQCLLTPVEVTDEIVTSIFTQTLEFLFEGNVPDDLAQLILDRPLRKFVSKHRKLIHIDTSFLDELIQGNRYILTIIGQFMDVMERNESFFEFISTVVQKIMEIIESDEKERMPQFFNLSYFFLPMQRQLIAPDFTGSLCEDIKSMILSSYLQYNDGIVGNYLAIMPIFGDSGFQLFTELLPLANRPNGVAGICRGLYGFLSSAEKSTCPFEYKETVLSEEWINEMFESLFEQIRTMYQTMLFGNINLVDRGPYCAMFRFFFTCMRFFFSRITDEAYASFVEFMAEYLVRMGEFPDFVACAFEFLNTVYASKRVREGINLLELLEPMHSFLFSPKFNVDLFSSQPPDNYHSLITNLSKNSKYIEFSDRMKRILDTFRMPEEMSNAFFTQFEGNVDPVVLNMFLEQMIANRTFTLHQSE